MRRWWGAAAWTVLLLLVAADQEATKAVLSWLFPDRTEVLYPRADLWSLTLEHLGLVGASSALAALTGVGLGVWVTRSGAAFRPLADRLASLGQTFPPAAVLALTIPWLGFGFGPTVLALWLYGTLPVLRGTLTGLAQVPQELKDAGRGMGFGPLGLFARLELPLALPYLWAGLRTSVVVNVGTAALGATVGAGGLGAPIVSGLVTQNYAFLLEGAVTAALLALALDAWFGAFPTSRRSRLEAPARNNQPSRAAKS